MLCYSSRVVKEVLKNTLANCELVRNESKKVHAGLNSSCALFQVVDRAVASQPEAPDAKERAEKFRNKFRLRLSVLQQQPA